MNIKIPQAIYDKARPLLDVYYASFWNNKWKKSVILYDARGLGTMMISDILQDTFKTTIDAFKQLNNDSKALAVVKWTRGNIGYMGDFENNKEIEFWQYASETWKSKKGDCEDEAILMYKLLRNLGVPAFRLKLCAGDVVSPSNPQDLVGHCYLIYLSEQYNDWFILDGCYYPELSVQRFLKVPHRDCPEYRTIWWTFSEIGMWAQHDTLAVYE